ncbi:hypothetical protein J6590_079390 [Homalodisca vitripennis]|nr:hypothetical protein J6590_079390 [Homalodisca vitripennis]
MDNPVSAVRVPVVVPPPPPRAAPSAAPAMETVTHVLTYGKSREHTKTLARVQMSVTIANSKRLSVNRGRCYLCVRCQVMVKFGSESTERTMAGDGWIARYNNCSADIRQCLARCSHPHRDVFRPPLPRFVDVNSSPNKQFKPLPSETKLKDIKSRLG